MNFRYWEENNLSWYENNLSWYENNLNWYENNLNWYKNNLNWYEDYASENNVLKMVKWIPKMISLISTSHDDIQMN